MLDNFLSPAPVSTLIGGHSLVVFLDVTWEGKSLLVPPACEYEIVEKLGRVDVVYLLLFNQLLLQSGGSVEVGEGFYEFMALHEDCADIVEADALFSYIFKVLKDIKRFVVIE